MEHQSSQTPSSEEQAQNSYQSKTASAADLHLEQRVSSQDAKELLPPTEIEQPSQQSVLPPKGVAFREVERLYRKLRKAILGSKARELQKQVQSHVHNSLGLSESLDLSLKLDENLDCFDPYVNSIPYVNFLGLRFHRMTQAETVEKLFSLTRSDKAYRVYFANAHSIEVAAHNSEFCQAIKRSNLLLPDGSGVLIGSRLHGKPLTFNLNGTDLLPAFFQAASPKRKLSVYFLGAKSGVAEKAAISLANKYPNIYIAGVRDGYFSNSELPTVLQDIRNAKPDILLVAMGTPIQEIWINRYSEQLPGIVSIAVGGLFDFMAGCVPRAPKIFRVLGIEWIWRLLMEPGRLWRRYTVGNLRYLSILISSWYSSDTFLGKR